MKYLFPIFFLLGFPLIGQQIGAMETDRPDQTECPYIVKRGYVQAEMGYNVNNELWSKNYNLPSTLWKYGLTEWIEIRYINNVKIDSSLSFKQESIGFKLKIFEKRKFLPLTSLIVHYNFRDDKRDVSDKNIGPHSFGQIVLTLQHPVYKNLGMGYNFGIELHEDGTNEGIYRLSPGINFAKKWYAYAEVFGRFPTSLVTDHWFDGGLAYYFSDHIKTDISAGKSFKTQEEWYFSIGFSFRFKVKK